MPLEGFHVVRWASEQFGAMSAMYLGGFSLVALIIGVALIVGGAKQVPASWALVIAGLASCVIAYFIVGSAISGTGQIAHNARVESAAWRQGPYVVATMIGGVAGYIFRLGIRAWSSEENSGKAFGVLLWLASLSGFFVSVQFVRGGLNPVNLPARATVSDDDNRIVDTTTQDDAPRRSVVAPRPR